MGSFQLCWLSGESSQTPLAGMGDAEAEALPSWLIAVLP